MYKKPIIIAVTGKKGGIGKTTTAVNVAAGFAEKGHEVLLVDLDPEANMSFWVDYQHDGKPTISELLLASIGNTISDYSDYIRRFTTENIDYIPASGTLKGLSMYLANQKNNNKIVKNILSSEYFNKYDYIIIDCPPADYLLSENAIVASNDLLIPVQCDIMAYNKSDDILQEIVNIKEDPNVASYIIGILPTMFQRGTNHSNEVLESIIESYGSLVFDTSISHSTKAKDASGLHVSSLSYSKSAKNVVGSEYRMVVESILDRLERKYA